MTKKYDIPQCPWFVKVQRQTSHAINRFGNFSANNLMAGITLLKFANSAFEPVESYGKKIG